MTLRVLTLNIWNEDGPWKERAAVIRGWIAQLQPDVIGLQEVLQGDGRDQARELVGEAYSVEYARATDFWGDPSLAFGNAVCSRWLITDREVLVLPDGGDDDRRVAVSTTIDAPFGPLSFTSTHLPWKPHHGWLRERHAQALGELVLRRRPAGGFPPLLVGDFNATPQATEIRYLSGLHALEGRSVYLRDAWAQAGDGGPGFTMSRTNPYAGNPLAPPDSRIDYLFAGPPRADGLGVIESCRLVCNAATDGIWPSDHFGVYAELRTEPLP